MCYDCQKGEMKGSIRNPAMKKLFDIPESFYMTNAFLRSVKVNYLKFGELSPKQIEYFQKTVKELKAAGKNKT